MHHRCRGCRLSGYWWCGRRRQSTVSLSSKPQSPKNPPMLTMSTHTCIYLVNYTGTCDESVSILLRIEGGREMTELSFHAHGRDALMGKQLSSKWPRVRKSTSKTKNSGLILVRAEWSWIGDKFHNLDSTFGNERNSRCCSVEFGVCASSLLE